jgi:hypothetical protein
MKLAACGKESFASLGQQFNEGIVVTLSRQLNQIYFILPEREIMQEPLAQIRWYHSLPGQAGGIR